MNDLYTIGHSTHTIERFLELLRSHAISAVGDVRSAPYSRYTPQFNHDALAASLRRAGIMHVFLGRYLGARPDDPACYRNKKVRFDLLAKTALFQEGLERVRKGLLDHRIALMCAEKDPITCHRMVLVCRHLRKDDFNIRHIREDASMEKHHLAERRLMQEMNVPETDLFADEEELVLRAYDLQAERIAFVEKKDGEEDQP